MEEFPLIEQLKHYNLDFLIPEKIEFDSFEEEEAGRRLDPAEDEYYDYYHI